MNRLEPLVAAAGCERCPARLPADESGAPVQGDILAQSQRWLEATGHARATVLRSFGHGAFLVRHRENRMGHGCPLLDYEVSRFDEGDWAGHEPEPPAAPPERQTACLHLLQLSMAGLI